MSNRLDGGCLCGSVRYSCEAEPLLTAICHCPDCQKQTSAPFAVVVAVPKGSLQDRGPNAQDLRQHGRQRADGAPELLRPLRLADQDVRRGHAGGGVHQGRDARRHLLARADHGGLVCDGPALGEDRPVEAARGPQPTARRLTESLPLPACGGAGDREGLPTPPRARVPQVPRRSRGQSATCRRRHRERRTGWSCRSRASRPAAGWRAFGRSAPDLLSVSGANQRSTWLIPGGRGRGEVDVIAGPLGQPVPNELRFVGRRVVQHEMHVAVRRS